VAVFRVKVDFSRRKSATKFLCVKTFSGNVVRHSLAYLNLHKWLVGDRLILPKILTYPVQRRRLPVDIRS